MPGKLHDSVPCLAGTAPWDRRMLRERCFMQSGRPAKGDDITALPATATGGGSDDGEALLPHARCSKFQHADSVGS